MTREEAEDLLYREAMLLDERRWDEWLDLYLPDASFWMPAWRDEAEPAADPESELSLIYYAGRRGIEERVWRLRSGQSVASIVLPRTVHQVSNVMVETAVDGEASIGASWTVHQFDPRSQRTHVFFGRYAYRACRTPAGWKIGAKKILLMNDLIPTVVDFYSV